MRYGWFHSRWATVWVGMALLTTLLPARADRPRSPFGVAVEAATNRWTVRFTVPTGCVLYADRLRFESADGQDVAVAFQPAPERHTDPVTGREKLVYPADFALQLVPSGTFPTALTVKFQGCREAECFFPEKRTFRLTAIGLAEELKPDAAKRETATNTPAPWIESAQHFQVAGTQTGYLRPTEFVAFLDQARHGNGPADPLASFHQAGLVLTLALILLGGVGLNLTPCVLPLIPVNLAIIGAGKSARSRLDGFGRGAAYGAGMALSYGALGLFVVLTGAKFGTLNSSPWFNLVVAVVFLVLAGGMFGGYNLDFTRYEGSVGGQVRNWRHAGLVAFGLGVLAALLAGACVAPVVISVLLLAASFYSHGHVLGLALPFLLGLGMALPWPLAGASLTFLPKPGRWMERVKQAFGVLILVFAGYYGWLAVGLFSQAHASTRLADAPTGAISSANSGDSSQELRQGLEQALANGKPVLVDFQASWCKNCAAMEETVFNQPSVQAALRDFVVIQYHAEQPNESPAREVLDHFGALGLPTYVVLRPTSSPANLNSN